MTTTPTPIIHIAAQTNVTPGCTQALGTAVHNGDTYHWAATVWHRDTRYITVVDADDGLVSAPGYTPPASVIWLLDPIETAIAAAAGLCPHLCGHSPYDLQCDDPDYTINPCCRIKNATEEPESEWLHLDECPVAGARMERG